MAFTGPREAIHDISARTSRPIWAVGPRTADAPALAARPTARPSCARTGRAS